MKKLYDTPFTIQNEDGKCPVIFTVEHAENIIPEYLNNLGLYGEDLTRHIAWDIGIKEVCKIVSNKLDIPTIYGGYSRLVCEINRSIDSGKLFYTESDGTIIKDNENLSEEEKNRRIEEVFNTYHKAADKLVDRIVKKHSPNNPIVFSMHSFTHKLNTEDKERPWEVCISTYSSDDLLQNVAKSFKDMNIIVGINEPFNLKNYPGVSLDTHANQKGLPNILIEIRQDLISNPKDIEKWAKIIIDVIKEQL